MSSYLTFYGIPKLETENKEGLVEPKTEDTNAKPVAIVSFSRNNDIYRYFDENLNIAFCFNEDKYSEISGADVNKVESDIQNDIRMSEKRLYEYEKYAGNNPEYIQEILSVKEYLEDLYRVLHYTEFIAHIVNEASFKYKGGFTKIVANIS